MQDINEKYTGQSKELIKEIMKIAGTSLFPHRWFSLFTLQVRFPGSYLPVIEEAHAVLALIDIFATLAHVSASASGSAWIRPQLSPLVMQ